jgi:hypothetical protein
MIIIKKNAARTTPETVHRIMRISKGKNHNSVVIIIEVFSNVITVVRDVKEKENVVILLILEKACSQLCTCLMSNYNKSLFYLKAFLMIMREYNLSISCCGIKKR